jgi:dTDP-4-amino-4,6-dideoxygalactose transaminase
VVPVVDVSRRGARFAAEFAEVAGRIARRGSYLLGEELESFERELAAWIHAGHAAGVASGASALQLALTASGVGPGDDVLVPAFTAVPTASAVVAAGATPVAVDVDRATACVTPAALERASTRRTRAAIVVHLYGFPAELPSPGGELMVIEDAAQAMGALGPPDRSRAAVYSFYPTKNLGGIGDGGAVVTHDAALDATVRLLRAHGLSGQYLHEVVSQNFRMSEIEAAWLRLGLATVASDVEARRVIAARYRAAAPQLRWQRDDPRHAYHLCVFRTRQRDADRERLASAGVATAIHYPRALTQQPAYRSWFPESCPEAEAWAAECVSVPCFPELTEDEIEFVAGALAELPTRAPCDHG